MNIDNKISRPPRQRRRGRSSIRGGESDAVTERKTKKQEREKQQFYPLEGVGNIPVISLEKLKNEKSEFLTDNSEEYWYGGVNSGGYVGKKVDIDLIDVEIEGEKSVLIIRTETFFNKSSFRHDYDDYDSYGPQEEYIVVRGANPEQIELKKELIHGDEKVLKALESAGYPTASQEWTDDRLSVEDVPDSVESLEFDATAWYGGENSGGTRGWKKRIVDETDEAIVTREYWVNNSWYDDHERYEDTVTVYLK